MADTPEPYPSRARADAGADAGADEARPVTEATSGSVSASIHPRMQDQVNSYKSKAREFARRFAYRMLLRELPSPFEHVSGHCWQVKLPKLGSTQSDSVKPLLLFENDRYLGPEHPRLDYVTSVGRGWYSRDDRNVYFSASDNSDPTANGRTYSYSTSPWLHSRNSGAPDNLRVRSNDREALRQDVSYVVDGMWYLDSARQAGLRDFAGLTMLEIGPGINCGFAILLACFGAKPIVVDPYPVKWDERYHLPFFQLLRSELDGRPGVDLSPIDQLIDANDFDSSVIQRFDFPVELLDLEDDSIDIVCSNAVGEHFYDVDEAFRQLYRVTKPGGYGFHQVDFGDHRDFTRPLEYLLMSDSVFQMEFGLHRGEIGNRVRAEEMSCSITSSGLEIVNFDPNHFVDAEYLAQFLLRLRSCGESPYREIAEEQLRVLAGRYVTRKL